MTNEHINITITKMQLKLNILDKKNKKFKYFIFLSNSNHTSIENILFVGICKWMNIKLI